MISPKLLRNFALFIMLYTLLVILAGGVVRTTQSGMGCPDWPTCFGQWIPPTNASELPADYERYLRKQDIDHTFNVYHTWIEAINRYIAALLGLFALIQVALLFAKRKSHKKAFALAALYLLLVLVIGVVGAVVVRLNLAHLSISLHLALALLLLIVQLLLIVTLQARPFIITSKQQYYLLGYTMVLIILQVTMGTVVRMHIDDVSKALSYTNRALWLQDAPTIFIVHRSSSWLVMGIIAYLIYKSKNNIWLYKQAIILGVLAVLNMAVGIILYYANMPATAQPIHLLLAALVIVQLAYMLMVTKHNSA